MSAAASAADAPEGYEHFHGVVAETGYEDRTPYERAQRELAHERAVEILNQELEKVMARPGPGRVWWVLPSVEQLVWHSPDGALRRIAQALDALQANLELEPHPTLPRLFTMRSS